MEFRLLPNLPVSGVEVALNELVGRKAEGWEVIGIVAGTNPGTLTVLLQRSARKTK